MSNYLNIFIVISKYCETKCLVWRGPKDDPNIRTSDSSLVRSFFKRVLVWLQNSYLQKAEKCAKILKVFLEAFLSQLTKINSVFIICIVNIHRELLTGPICTQCQTGLARLRDSGTGSAENLWEAKPLNATVRRSRPGRLKYILVRQCVPLTLTLLTLKPRNSAFVITVFDENNSVTLTLK